MDEILNEKGILSSELRNPLTCLIEQNSIMSGIFLNLNRPTEWGSIIPGWFDPWTPWQLRMGWDKTLLSYKSLILGISLWVKWHWRNFLFHLMKYFNFLRRCRRKETMKHRRCGAPNVSLQVAWNLFFPKYKIKDILKNLLAYCTWISLNGFQTSFIIFRWWALHKKLRFLE